MSFFPLGSHLESHLHSAVTPPSVPPSRTTPPSVMTLTLLQRVLAVDLSKVPQLRSVWCFLMMQFEFCTSGPAPTGVPSCPPGPLARWHMMSECLITGGGMLTGQASLWSHYPSWLLRVFQGDALKLCSSLFLAYFHLWIPLMRLIWKLVLWYLRNGFLLKMRFFTCINWNSVWNQYLYLFRYL